MIDPVVGRHVWYWPQGADGTMRVYGINTPLAAIITYVWNPRMVNLVVFDHGGEDYQRTSVTLLQDDDFRPPLGRFCEWMPFQRGQAKA